MMKRIFIGLIVFGIGLSILDSAQAEVPTQPSRVYAKGNQLIVEKRLENGQLDRPKPYLIKGVTWQPATKALAVGPNPLNPAENVQYGFFFDWPGRIPPGYEVLNYWMKNEFLKHYKEDISLMREMNVNTVRVYTDFGSNPAVYKEILNEFYCNDIMVIMTVAISKEDIDSGRYLSIIKLCKNHPAILMWSLGNEWNLEYNKYYGYSTVEEASIVTNQAARIIRKIDPNHPVSSCLGDRFTDLNNKNTIAYVISVCPNVDVWGLNIYRGKSFGNLFGQWQQISPKPFYLSEFGTDSFRTKAYKATKDNQADDCEGYEDQKTQNVFVLGLWKEIENHLSTIYPSRQCLGGLVHEFNDELWKVGSYHTGLGGLVDYNGVDNIDNTSDDDHSYDDYNSEGFILLNGHPDKVANEEYFGVVDAQRNLKDVFLGLQRYYRQLDYLYSSGEYYGSGGYYGGGYYGGYY